MRTPQLSVTQLQRPRCCTFPARCRSASAASVPSNAVPASFPGRLRAVAEELSSEDNAPELAGLALVSSTHLASHTPINPETLSLRLSGDLVCQLGLARVGRPDLQHWRPLPQQLVRIREVLEGLTGES